MLSENAEQAFKATKSHKLDAVRRLGRLECRSFHIVPIEGPFPGEKSLPRIDRGQDVFINDYSRVQGRIKNASSDFAKAKDSSPPLVVKGMPCSLEGAPKEVDVIDVID